MGGESTLPSLPPPREPSSGSRSTPPRLVVAFDFGRRRIGVACGDTLSRTARPLVALDNSPAHPPWGAMETLLHEWQPALLVVGLPYNTDGSESAMSGTVRAFAAELVRRHGLEVRFVDERYSSLEAGNRLKAARQSGLRKHRVGKADVDAAAACVILERWFFESH